MDMEEAGNKVESSVTKSNVSRLDHTPFVVSFMYPILVRNRLECIYFCINSSNIFSIWCREQTQDMDKISTSTGSFSLNNSV